MLLRINYLLVTLLWIAVPLCKSQSIEKPIEINDVIDQSIYPLSDLLYFEDTIGTLGFNEISSAPFQNHFKYNAAYSKKDFNPESTYWVKMVIHHNAQSKKNWLLEFYDQTIDEIIVFLPELDGTYEIQTMGDRLEFSKRWFQHKNFEVVINNNTDKTLIYYFKIRSHESADIRIALRSFNQFIYYILNEYFLFGLFFGMVLIISLYNLLMYFAMKENKYIIYILYLLSVGVYAMSRDGIAYQYLWSNAPSWNQISTGVAIYFVVLWALLFTKNFLKTKTNAPILDKAIVLLIIFRSIIFIIALFINPHLFSYRIIEIVPVSLIFYTSIHIRLKGYKPARFAVVAYGVLFISFIIKALVDSGLFPFSIVSHYSLRVGFLIEMLFLTFALGDEVRILKDKRDRAQKKVIKEHEINVRLNDKVNRELEKKVKKRTKQLRKSNQKLANQAKEIEQINSILDLDNWKLKNNLKEVVKDMVFKKYLTYQDFHPIFPDQVACYGYLEKLKWEEGYHCRKCNNYKYFSGSKKFSRRCSKCGYNESVTSFTLFHGIKFPIEKAFYLLYVVTNNDINYTLDELSEMLDLRRNTLWNFKNKIINILNSDKRHHVIGIIKNWNDVLKN